MPNPVDWNSSTNDKKSNYNTFSFGDALIENDYPVLGQIWNELSGNTAQQREFAQQEYLMDKQNEYNDPSAQMKRMIDAGINPNLAAAGIAGGGNESAQAPSVASNTGGASNALNSGASLLGAASSSVGSLAAASLASAQKRNFDASSEEMLANAKRVSTLLDYEVGKFQAETAKTWVDAGMNEHIANYWSVKAAYADRQEWLDTQSKVWSIAQVQSNIDNLQKEYEIKCEDLKIRKQQLSQEEFRTQQMAIDTYFANERKRIYGEFGIDITKQEDGMLIEAYANGHIDMILGAFKDRAKAVNDGVVAAEMDRLRERLQIENEEYLNRRTKELEQDKQFQEDMAKLGLSKEAISTVIQSILHYIFGTGFSVNIGKVGVTNNEPKH